MKSKVDPCIFCDKAPCECNKPPARKKRIQEGHFLANGAKTDKSPLTSQDKSDKSETSDMSLEQLAIRKPGAHLAAMQRAAQNAPKAQQPATVAEPKPIHKVKIHAVPDEELAWNAAIRNLAPLLHPDEVERYAAIISSEPHPDERKAVWKMRRRDGVLE